MNLDKIAHRAAQRHREVLRRDNVKARTHDRRTVRARCKGGL